MIRIAFHKQLLLRGRRVVTVPFSWAHDVRNCFTLHVSTIRIFIGLKLAQTRRSAGSLHMLKKRGATPPFNKRKRLAFRGTERDDICSWRLPQTG